MGRYLFITLLLVFVAGCGYHPPGRGSGLGPDIKTVYVETFSNRTAKPFLDTFVTNNVIDRFRRDRRTELVTAPEGADATITGVVQSYTSSSVAYDQKDNILKYRSSMTISATARRNSDGRVLWKGTVSWKAESDSDPNKTVEETRERVAIDQVCERIAEQLYYRIQENF